MFIYNNNKETDRDCKRKSSTSNSDKVKTKKIKSKRVITKSNKQYLQSLGFTVRKI